MTEEMLFHAALARRPDERGAFLGVACAGQPELRAAIEARLAAHAASGSAHNQPPNHSPEELAQTVDFAPMGARPGASGEYTPECDEERPSPATTTDYQPNTERGLRIAGRYTLVETIGEGGMGEVWVAKQTEPIKRKVALKLIKTGMDSKAVVARFEQERQALALMEHPNIARVLDGGMTATGQPFFVMELVNGVPLTKFCDESMLKPKERLELFVPICRAVQHAHQKGIIHRDLKPANILVTLIDGKPVPKVIDFGVAKATGGKLTDESLSTQFGAVIGSLEYMSPEQAGFSGVDIDTRADIYSLGVILYELLTGLKPHDGKRLKNAAFTDMIRIIQEEEPSKPSTRLSIDESLPSLAVLRQTEPKKLMALLRGELNWVVMKCLEKQRDRRYETANALARDIQRYLADEPVEARPASFGYRAGKFLRRHKGPVLAATVIVLLLVAGIAISSWLAVRATRAEKLADQRRTQLEKALKESVESHKQAQGVSSFLMSVFRKSDPWNTQQPMTVEEMLQNARANLPRAFHDNPRIRAELLDALGQTFTRAGLQNDGVELLRDAYNVRLREHGENGPRTIRSQGHLALALYLKGDVAEAVALSESAMEQARKLWKQNDSDSPIPELLGNLALMYTAKGETQKAVLLCQQALDLSRAAKGPDDPDTAIAMWQLARAYNNTNKPQEALPLAKASAEILQQQLGKFHPQCIAATNFYAMALGKSNNWKEALRILEELYERNKKNLGPANLRTLEYAITELSHGYLNTGQHKKLIELVEPAVKHYAAGRGPDHFVVINGLGLLAIAHASSDDFTKALALCRETLKRAKEKHRRDSQMMRMIGDFLILSLPVTGPGSLDFNRKNLAQIDELLGSDHLITFYATMNLADAYSRTDRHAEAAPVMELAVQRARVHLPANHLWLETALDWLATNQLSQQKHQAAEALLRECLAMRAKRMPDSWLTFQTKSMLGGALMGQKNLADAEPLLLAAYEGMKQREKSIPFNGKVRLAEALERLVQLYDAWDKKEEAAKWRTELAAINGAARKQKTRP